jgi:hypothetical protein
MYRFQGSTATNEESKGRWATLKSDDKPAVNTSLPARMAPKLAPTTLAQATHAPLKPMNKKAAPASQSLDEFPSLSKPKAQSAPLAPSMAPSEPSAPSASYANLSKNWAKKQQEDKEKEKEEKEAAARWNALQREQREKEERSFQRTGIISFPHIQKKVDSDEEKYLEEERVSSEEDLSLEEEEEEEEEFVTDEGWGNRKHKYDIY